jgi:hypothetical protein
MQQCKEELKMQDEPTRVNAVCRRCGCKEAQAIADARALNFLDEFLAGIYTCCQVAQWADEQWLAWLEAGREDGKPLEEVTRPLEVESDALFVPVHLTTPSSPADLKR